MTVSNARTSYAYRIPMREGTQRMQKLNIIFQLKFLRQRMCTRRACSSLSLSREANGMERSIWQHMRTFQRQRNRVDAHSCSESKCWMNSHAVWINISRLNSIGGSHTISEDLATGSAYRPPKNLKSKWWANDGRTSVDRKLEFKVKT